MPPSALKLWRGQKRCRRGEERKGERGKERRGEERRERRGCSPLACLESRFPVNLLLVLDHADRRTRLTKESRIFLHGSTQRRKTMALTWGTESMAQQDKHTHTQIHAKKGTHNQHKCGKWTQTVNSNTNDQMYLCWLRCHRVHYLLQGNMIASVK